MEKITSMLLQSNIVGLQYVQKKVITIRGFRFTMHTDDCHDMASHQFPSYLLTTQTLRMSD